MTQPSTSSKVLGVDPVQTTAVASNSGAPRFVHVPPEVATLNAAIMLAEANGFVGLRDALTAMLPKPRRFPRLMTRAECRNIFCVYCDAMLDPDTRACERCGEVGDVYEEGST